LVWPGVEGLEGNGAVHSNAGMASFGVVPALMVSVGTPVPADSLEPGDRDGCPRCRFVVGLLGRVCGSAAGLVVRMCRFMIGGV
jgi:hypothetical protein